MSETAANDQSTTTDAASEYSRHWSKRLRLDRVPAWTWTALGVAAMVLITAMIHWPWRNHVVIDWDESTFLLVGSSLWSGYLPYEQAFDNKPPLAFLLAAVPAAFGADIAYVRLFHLLATAAVGCMVYRIAMPYAGHLIAWGAALLFVLHQRTWDSMHLTTEVMALLFFLPAVGLVMRYRFERHTFWIGVLLGCACLIRSNLAIAVVVMTAYLFLIQFQLNWGYWRRVLWYTAGGFLPIVLFTAVYLVRGTFDSLVTGAIYVPLAYAGTEGGMASNVSEWAELFRDKLAVSRKLLQATTGLLIIGVAAVAWARWKTGWRRGVNPLDFLVVCIIAVTLSVLMSGEVFPHYALQIIPFVALIAAAVGTVVWARHPAAQAAALVVVLGLSAHTIQRNHTLAASSTDPTPDLKAYLEQELEPDDTLWLQRSHILYWLLDRPIVTAPIIHPSNLFRESVRDALIEHGQLEPDHLERLIDSKPRFIVWPTDENEHPSEIQIRDRFESQYDKIEVFGVWQLYEHRPSTAPQDDLQ